MRLTEIVTSVSADLLNTRSVSGWSASFYRRRHGGRYCRSSGRRGSLAGTREAAAGIRLGRTRSQRPGRGTDPRWFPDSAKWRFARTQSTRSREGNTNS